LQVIDFKPRKFIKPEICITGASGFIGSSMSNILRNNGQDVFVWKRRTPFDFGRASIIVHFAGKVHQPRNSVQNTIEAFRKVNRDLTMEIALHAVKKEIKKFIFISTVKVVGEKPGHYDISSPCCPSDPYGISKLEAESGLRKIFSSQSKSTCVILRLPMVYGPGNKGNMLSLLSMSKKKIPLPLASVKSKRSMISVMNVCDAILTVINDTIQQRATVQTYFLNDGKDMTSAELYSAIFREMNNRRGVFPIHGGFFQFIRKTAAVLNQIIEKKVTSIPDIVSRLFDEYRFSSLEFKEDYSWTPPVSIEQGIRETVDWYLSEKAQDN
jgi:nucleoside-diphosphate-sugar epimerase